MYDQPENSLVAYWTEKPTLEQVAKMIGTTFPGRDDDETLRIVNIWSGQCIRMPADDTDYWIQQVQANKKVPSL